jgi:hypothetical protein
MGASRAFLFLKNRALTHTRGRLREARVVPQKDFSLEHSKTILFTTSSGALCDVLAFLWAALLSAIQLPAQTLSGTLGCRCSC